MIINYFWTVSIIFKDLEYEVMHLATQRIKNLRLWLQWFLFAWTLI